MINKDKGFLELFLETNPATKNLMRALNLVDKDIVEQTKRTVTGAATDVGQESLQI